MNEAANMAELPSQDERTMAILAHVLQLVGTFIAPLVILLTKRESRFVSFHAVQALLLQIAYMALMFVFFVLWFGLFFMIMAHHPPAKDALPPPMFFVMFPLVWLGFMGTWVVMLVVAIVHGITAGRGEWADYPLLGSLARKY
jgi:hypothetical protein